MIPTKHKTKIEKKDSSEMNISNNSYSRARDSWANDLNDRTTTMLA